MNQTVCRHNKYGHCKYGDKCHFRHVHVICVNEKCSDFECENRHPVVCNYYRNFKRCKYSNCSYKHESRNENVETDVRIRNMEKRLSRAGTISKI